MKFKPMSHHLPSKADIYQCLLVANAIGTEVFLASLFVLMVANLRTMNVPVAYTSLPCFLSASLGAIQIFFFRGIIEKFAVTKARRACMIVCTSFEQYLGALLIVLGNILNLYDDQTSDISPTVNSSVFQNASHISSHILNVMPEAESSVLPFSYNALVLIFGYTFLDAGYDTSNLALKTFVMITAPKEQHPSLFVKASSFTSFGGVFVTLLGSLSIGEWLTAGTLYDATSVSAIFISGACLVVGLVSLSITLLTGFCLYASDPRNDSANDEEQSWLDDQVTDEKATLVSSHGDKVSDAVDILSRSGLFHLEHSLASNSLHLGYRTGGEPHVDKRDDADTDGEKSSKVKGFIESLRQNTLRICLCTATFFGACSFFLFDTYSINFAGISIYKGDPSAPLESQEYGNFLKGEKAGSIGLLLFYTSYMLLGLRQNWLLSKVGWWRQVWVVSVVYIAITACCAVFKLEWLYFLASCVTGCYRLSVYTFPFLLINSAAERSQDSDEKKTSRSNTDMALASLMFPTSFIVGSALTGPLISWTGSAATSVYATVVTTGSALIAYWFIRKY